MNSVDFCFWLQGFFEIGGNTQITNEQAEIIKNHLALVFVHEIDQIRNSQTHVPAETLQNVHDGKTFTKPGKNDPLMRC